MWRSPPGSRALGPVGGRGAGAELARLGDRAAGQLAAADPGREAEVVLDPPRGAGLAAEHGALDDQRVEALRGAVDGGAEAGRAAAEDQQVDLLARLQLEPDPQRPRELAVARPPQLAAAGQADERDLGRRRARRSAPPPRSLSVRRQPGEGQAHAPREVDQVAGSRASRPGRRSRSRSLPAAGAIRGARRRRRAAGRRASRPRRAASAALRGRRRCSAAARSTTAVRKTVWPESRFISPRKPDGAVADDLAGRRGRGPRPRPRGSR